MELEAEITDMFFVKSKKKKIDNKKPIDEEDAKNKQLGYLKKNYIYRKKDGSISYRNMGVKKKNSPDVCRYIFNEILIPKISNERKAKFSELYMKDLIHSILNKDISKSTIRYSVKPFEMYASMSTPQAQISKIYGPGIHFMIPVKKDVFENGIPVTSGIDKKYISLEKFKEHNLTVTDINLDIIFSGIEYFIKDSQKSLADFFG